SLTGPWRTAESTARHVDGPPHPPHRPRPRARAARPADGERGHRWGCGGGERRSGAPMTITFHNDLVQGSDEWHQARCGLLTASEIDRILTPKLKIADNAKTRAHLWELAAQRISEYVEPQYISDAMLRGHED